MFSKIFHQISSKGFVGTDRVVESPFMGAT